MTDKIPLQRRLEKNILKASSPLVSEEEVTAQAVYARRESNALSTNASSV